VTIFNAHAQALVVSVAEVLVCWAVVGSVSESLLQDRGRWVSAILAAVIASVLFGVYHFAHCPPFNTVGSVVLLTVIGLVTSAFFVSRDVYGTIAFHNFLGIFGVIRALKASGVEDHRNVEHVEEEYGAVQEGKQYRPLVVYREEEKRHGGKSRATRLGEGDAQRLSPQ
jgi:hypothetical protein